MQRSRFLIAVFALITPAALPGMARGESPLPPGPDLKDVVSLPRVGNPRISPDGSAIVYPLRTTDWENNRFDTELWLARDGEAPFQLTRTADGNSTSPAWSPDGQWIAFLADRGNDTQIQILRATGGEARPLTSVKDGVSGFKWSPDGRQLSVTITDPVPPQREQLEETYGKYAVEDGEYRMTHLWVLDFAQALESDAGVALPEEDADDGDAPCPFRRLTHDPTYTIADYAWSPDSREIAFEHKPDPRTQAFEWSDLSVVTLDTGAMRTLVEQTGYDGKPRWSPDGASIVFQTAMGKVGYYNNDVLAVVPASGGTPHVLTADFDENPALETWLPDGIVFSAILRTHRRLFRQDPAGGEPVLLLESPRLIWSVDYAADGQTFVMRAEDGARALPEVYRMGPGQTAPVAVSNVTEATGDWQVGTRDRIQWTSEDGTRIEGVVAFPPDFDPARKHPLLVIIHGGPTWFSYPARSYGAIYPVQQWLAKGAIILMPNYRGSAGRGEAFRSLNIRNMGVGDAWDVMSGVDHLVAQGFIDESRMGAMGWSQGGYISAFLTTTTDRFQAISVGAGISNWMTYYVNTDIHPFTRHYLQATPWSDPEIYARTSPMTYINDAVTPTLIQHGEFDTRVPTPNARELYQGLRDVGVETRLIIYQDFGHSIRKPKERLAAGWHNWQWFAKHIWGEEVEIPVEEEAK